MAVTDRKTPLQIAREAAGLSRGQLARRAEISETYVFRLEKRERKAPTALIANRLAAAVGVRPEDLWPLHDTAAGE